jgi:hypothetical protein
MMTKGRGSRPWFDSNIENNARVKRGREGGREKKKEDKQTKTINNPLIEQKEEKRE